MGVRNGRVVRISVGGKVRAGSELAESHITQRFWVCGQGNKGVVGALASVTRVK